MTDVFQNILTASFHGSIVILVVIVLRLLLKKTPKKYLCLLWLLAGIQLLMPFEIRSGLSLQPKDQPELPRFTQTEQEVWRDDWIPQENGAGVGFAFVADTQQEGEHMVVTMPAGTEASTQGNQPASRGDPGVLLRLDAVAAILWAVVAVCFAVYTLVSYLCLKLRVRDAIRLKDNVWESDRIETAFVLGFIRPQIYLPMGMSPSNRRYILAHEQTHMEKGDHWFKMVGFLALALHWFNPLVWLAYVLLCKDIEMACDERVVQFMDLEERKMYSAALVNCSTNHVHFAACPVAFGEVSVKERVLTVLQYKKPSFWISLAGVLAIIFVAVCLVTSPMERKETNTDPTQSETQGNVVSVKTVDEFLAAIASDTEIRLEAGSYNLTQAADYGEKKPAGDAYTWEEAYDGYGLVIRNVKNLTITGGSMRNTALETEPRWADVLSLQRCENVNLSGITLGHIKGHGECTGGVVSLQRCTQVKLERVGLYGCGVVGVIADESNQITLVDSEIYECSSSAVQLSGCEGVIITDNRMYDIGLNQYGGYCFWDIARSKDVKLLDNWLSSSNLYCLVNAGDSQITMERNQFTENAVTDAAFYLYDCDVSFTANQFKDNSIRVWLRNNQTSTLQDADGNPITEEALRAEFGTKIAPPVPSANQLEIHVSTVDELLAAIGSNKDIVLDGELYDFSTATDYGTGKTEAFHWEDIFDGPGLVIENVDNMTIRSADGDVKAHTLSATPRYANVLSFRNCSNITLFGFTAGHTKEPGSCAGGVLDFQNSDGIIVDNCGLFGCGILGVKADYSSALTVRNCEIYECSQGGIKLYSVEGVTLDNNTFRDIGGWSIMDFQMCNDVTLDGQPIQGTMSISLPEQEAAQNLGSVLNDFMCAYFDKDTEGMKQYLSQSCTQELTCYTGSENAMGDSYGEYLANVKEIDSKGSSVVTCAYWRENADRTGTITMTVVKDGDNYRIREYHLDADK